MDNNVLAKKKARRQSIFVVAKNNEKNSEFGQMYADLSPCIRFLTLIGIFPEPDKETGKKMFCVRLFRKLAVLIGHAFWFYVFFISLLSAVKLSRQFKTNFTLTLFSSLIAIIRFAVYMKMSKIQPTVHSIESFHLSVSKQRYRSIGKTVKFLCYGGTVAALIMAVISLEYLKLAGIFNPFARDFVFGFKFSNDTFIFVQYFPSIMFTSTIFYHHFIPLIVCLHICTIFYMLKNAIRGFADSLKHDRLEGAPDVVVCVLKFNRMLDIIAEVEDILGIAIFFSYGSMMTNQLCTMNSILLGNYLENHPAPLLKEAVMSIKNGIIFLCLTLFGASVTEEAERVLDEIRRLVTVPEQDFKKLSLLLQMSNNSKVSATAWKIFTLKRSLLLTTASVMTTYGMLLMQISQQKRAVNYDLFN